MKLERNTLRGPAVVLAFVVLALGHWSWHYRPRVRSTQPSHDAQASAVLDDSSFSQRVWLAYPHQNLGRLLEVIEETSDGSGSVGSALAALVGSAPVDSAGRPASLPAFGPFAVPPASEMAVAWQGDRLKVSARVYPGVAVVGRLAGWMAGNPWLAGGEVRSSSGPGLVSWDGRSWTYEIGDRETGRRTGAPRVSERSTGETEVAALARFAIAEQQGPLAPGRYRVERKGELIFQILPERHAVSKRDLTELPDFESLPVSKQWPLPALDGGAAVLLVDGRGGMLDGRSALLVVEQPILGGSLQLPRSVALAEGPDPELSDEETNEDNPRARAEVRSGTQGGEAESEIGASERFSLPGEDLARRLQVDLREGYRAGWSIHAMDRRSKSLGSAIVPTIEELLKAGDSELSFGVWLRPEPLHQIARSLSNALESVPFVSKRDRRRWRDLEALTAALLPYERLIVLVYESGGVEIRFVPG